MFVDIHGITYSIDLPPSMSRSDFLKMTIDEQQATIDYLEKQEYYDWVDEVEDE